MTQSPCVKREKELHRSLLCIFVDCDLWVNQAAKHLFLLTKYLNISSHSSGHRMLYSPVLCCCCCCSVWLFPPRLLLSTFTHTNVVWPKMCVVLFSSSIARRTKPLGATKAKIYITPFSFHFLLFIRKSTGLQTRGHGDLRMSALT